jgi:CBS domain-containing protein
MTAPAGVAAAAGERLAAAGPGVAAGSRAAIVVVCRDRGAREVLHRELSKRYGSDYQVVVCGRPAELAPWMRDLAAAGLPVAMVIGGVGAQDPDGVEVLAGIRAIDPTALRVAAVGWGDWPSLRSVLDAVAVGTIDHWVNRPVQAPAEEFHHWITEFLRGVEQPARRRLRAGAGTTALIVVDAQSGQPAGIITETDVAHAIADGKDVNDVWVCAVMTSRPAVITTTSIRDAAEMMTDRHFRHLPVVGDAGLLGVVDIIDACQALISPGEG